MSAWFDLFHPQYPVPIIARRMVILFNILLVVIPLFNVIVWSLPGTQIFTFISDQLVSVGYQPLEIFTSGGMVNPADITWTLASKIEIVLLKTIQLTPMLIGLFLLKLIFENYKKEDIFITQNAQYYRWIGALLWWDSMGVRPLCNVFSNAVVGFSHHNAHVIMVGFNVNDAGNLIKFGCSLKESFIAALMFAISYVMLEGSRLREENQLTV